MCEPPQKCLPRTTVVPAPSVRPGSLSEWEIIGTTSQTSISFVMTTSWHGASLVATGGIVRIANGCTVEDGRVTEVRLPKSRLATLQADGCNAAVVVESDGRRRGIDIFAKKGAPVIAVNDGKIVRIGKSKRLGRFVKLLDVYATHTLQPTYDFAAVKEYLPNAVWTRNFNLHGRTLEEMRDSAFYRWDVSFVGNLDGVRYREHAERQRFLAALAPRLEAHGLRVLFRHSSGMSEVEQIEVIQRSVINLSYRSSCDHRSRSGAEMSWGLPERCYGVPARGGFVLADERRHAADDFDVSREWASYRDFEDCVARTRYFAAHFPETRAIAEAAHARVMHEHTYEHRAQRLLRIADAWRSALPALS